MKNLINTSIVMVLVLSLFSFAPATLTKTTEKAAVIKFDIDVIDYGTIQQNADGTRIFKFTNTGNAPLIITNVKTACGCTVPNYSRAPIAPGDTGELEIKYDTKRLGAFTKTITVMSNAASGNKALRIKGHVIAAK